MRGATDEELILAYAAGDQGAFEELYERHERPLFRFLLRSLADRAVAEELLQETWIGVIRNAASYEPRALFRTWLYRIARTRLIDHWRAREPATVLSLDAPVGAESDEPLAASIADGPDRQPELVAIGKAQAAAFVAAVEALPAAQREAFLLQAESELSLAEIAEITGAGIETVKSRLRYAVAKLRGVKEAWS